ncbi:MAG: HU family DNA-binding protein [Candidatus Eisenbacteria bacterium]|uniref:HU family DNA-binding protein n=1 Tax=Eiseniibacteriota bacterium TaxID=2212470 RepID=A0A948RVN0_UNCEI|nr:HU family DNA-binding protein [Candidatus Eisenbacteria bacterium]MBU1951187.1 HU family DNA-binding protein [Candidatus Eisenbacteria bacterium]MBU2690317.1 HU family DNA-binding protein [Candidatus Eisenbacteria bacterium]
MNMSDIIAEISVYRGVPKTRTSRILREMLGTMERALSEGEEIELRRFGSFRIRERKRAQCKNPRTGKEFTIPAKILPVFRPSQRLRERVGEDVSREAYRGRSDLNGFGKET